MGTLIKWLVGILLAVVLLVIAAVVILPMAVDPNDYKPQIIEAAEKQLGRDLTIDKPLGLSVFPWLGIETGGVRVGNAPGFSEQPFAQVEAVGLKVRLIPLLSRRVEVDTLVLAGLNLSLEKDSTGKTNWEDLVGTAAETPAEAPVAEEPVSAGAPVALSIQGIQIEDARVSWDDRQTGQQVVLDGVRVVTGALAPGEAVPIEAGVVFTSTKPMMTLDADLSATVSTNTDMTAFDVTGLTLQLDADGEGLPQGGASLTLKADIAADTAADTLSVDNLRIDGPALSASGAVAIEALQTNPAAKGQLAIAETNLKTLASMFAVPVETVDPGALTRASGDLSFVYADGGLKLDPLSLSLDDSKLDGHIHLLDPAGPVVRMKLALDQIDLDRYMPPAAESTSSEETASAPPQASSAEPETPAVQGAPSEDPFAALRTLDLQAEFTVGQLKVNNARMSNVTTKIVSRGGVLKLDPIGADLYEGTFDGSVVFDASRKTPKVAAKQALTGIQIGRLLKDVAGQDRLEGKGQLQIDVTTVGLTESEIRRSLTGTSSFAFTDGALKGVNIAQIIRQGSQALGLGGGDASTGTPGQTDFTELTGSFQMKNGVIKNQDLKAKSPLLRIDGKGTVDLPRDTIDYLIETVLVGSLEGQGGKGRDELSGLPIPVRITGPLTKPSYRPDLEGALSAKAKQQLDEKKDELRQKAEEKIQDSVGDALKGLFR